MKKDLIVGAAVGYDWDQLKYWVKSIQQSGFEGDVALVGSNLKKDTIDRLKQENVILSLFGNEDADGNVTAPQNGAPHVERFFYLWNFLSKNEDKYSNVITTDVRDVIFQTNPSTWLEENFISHFLVASEEGMKYKDEPWGNQNLLETFGPYFHNILKEAPIRNVGVIAGEFGYVRSILMLLFQMSINRPISVVDQAVFNFIVALEPYCHDTLFTNNSDAWAIQLGTSYHAVAAGKGDLGMKYRTDMKAYEALYYDKQPLFTDEGEVTNAEEQKFCIVHQWDRIPFLKAMIEKKYGE